jgi:DNA (cytosine-5)-methyltransferase 1
VTMRPPILRASFDHRELVVDSFAGGGGASTGIAMALGRDPDLAINHDPIAIAMHAANHPATKHYLESVWKVDPVEACAGRPVGLAWFSPDCRHHSRAKGGKPREKKIRGLAWVVTRWARAVRPRVLVVENVEEFESWGPLDSTGHPVRARAGETFRAWIKKLRSYGYHVEWRSLVAADFGAPTTRRRLFLVARCDGQPIVWPEPTHGRGRAHAWRPAADIIDWSLPCPSIFERTRPLADATLRRIAEGIRRYVLEVAQPFIVRGGVAPTLIQTGYGEREGQTPRVPGLEKPLGTVVAGGSKHALVAAFVTKHYGSPPDRFRAVGHALTVPLSTVTAQDHHALTTVALSSADRRAEVDALLGKHGGHPQRGLFASSLRIVDIGMRQLVPRELFRAQSFPASYVIAPDHNGKPLTKTAQIALAGNSVPPVLAEAIVRANVCPAFEEARTA